MNKQNADESNELPLAAAFIINIRGTITYAYLDADYLNRAEPIDITKALQVIIRAVGLMMFLLRMIV